MNHKGTGMLETENLILRKFTLDDVDSSFGNWTSDDNVTKFLRWTTHESRNETESVISSWIASYVHLDFYQWAIVERKSNEVIGVISSVDMDEHIDMIHIGYALGSRYWNRGYMSEALSKVIEFLFKEVGASRIESQHDPNNPASGKVMQKCGMIYEGTMRKADWNNQGIVDAAVYAILREEYLA